MSVSFTITFYLWWLWAYLAAGVAIQPWLIWHYWKTTNNRGSLWGVVKRDFRPVVFVASVLLWPWALWEDLR